MSTGTKTGNAWDNIYSFFTPPKVSRPRAGDLYGGPRAFGGYTPEAARGGQASLNNLNVIANQGWNGADRSAFAAQQRQANQGEQAQRGAIMQNAAARGMSGGGMEFAQALAAQQGGANRAQEAGSQMAMAGADRRLQAAQAAGQMETQRGAATDQFNQWAAGMQADALKQQYEEDKENNKSWWQRMSLGLFS